MVVSVFDFDGIQLRNSNFSLYKYCTFWPDFNTWPFGIVVSAFALQARGPWYESWSGHNLFYHIFRQFLSYRDVQYLILTLSTIHFDLMKRNFALELIVFELYGQTSVPFFSWYTLLLFLNEIINKRHIIMLWKYEKNWKNKEKINEKNLWTEGGLNPRPLD